MTEKAVTTNEDQIRALIENWAEAVHGGDIDAKPARAAPPWCRSRRFSPPVAGALRREVRVLRPEPGSHDDDAFAGAGMAPNCR
jgi:hypothetical protein